MQLEAETIQQPSAEAKGGWQLCSSDLLAVSWGFGTNSTGLLCGLRERGIKPHLIIAADTGGENPHSIAYIPIMQAKVREWWDMEIVIVKSLRKGVHEGLENECLRQSRLPSLAYGFRGCSIKHKTEPFNKWVRKWMKENDVKHIVKAVGFDAGEAHRVKPSPLPWHTNWYPLVDWQWYRDDCIEAIKRHGLPQPAKSSCFFCPAMKRSEVLNLRDKHPELLKRALAIEDAAQKTVTTKRGLGGQGNLWRDWLAMDEAQSKMMLDIEPHEIPCACIDG